MSEALFGMAGGGGEADGEEEALGSSSGATYGTQAAGGSMGGGGADAPPTTERASEKSVTLSSLRGGDAGRGWGMPCVGHAVCGAAALRAGVGVAGSAARA